MAFVPDALLTLRRALVNNKSPISTLAPDDDDPATETPGAHELDLSKATHLYFNHAGHLSLPLDTPTRFESSSGPVNLRSVFFAWLKRDVVVTEYIAEVRNLDAALSSSASTGRVLNLPFVERVDLTTWLEGASDESDFIKPLDAEAAAAHAAAESAANVASAAQGGIAQVLDAMTASVRPTGRTIDPRLQEIYNGERRMGDRNSILRGIKPTDFSHVRKHCELFLGRNRTGGSSAAAKPTTSTLVQNRGKPAGSSGSSRHKEPIILLSPSASSLLRMSNIKSFLSDGLYTPPDSASGAANILHISRMMPGIDPQRPLRFIIVDSADQFKPEYWNRVVAVFTTGQLWQFKGYLWQSPPDLFSHALGVFVGWRGEDVPPAVKSWGRGVMSTHVDKYNAQLGPKARWRDREVVEGIWSAIEEHMRRQWGREAR